MAAADPGVLRVRLVSGSGPDVPSIDLSHWPLCALRGDGCVHLRLHLPGGVLRLDVIEGGMVCRPVAVEPATDLSRALDPQIATLRRIHALMHTGETALSDQRLVRLVEALRVCDALAAGASLRDIGSGVFGDDWPGDGEHLKSKVRRRVLLADRLLRAGPVDVLAGRI